MANYLANYASISLCRSTRALSLQMCPLAHWRVGVYTWETLQLNLNANDGPCLTDTGCRIKSALVSMCSWEMQGSVDSYKLVKPTVDMRCYEL